MQVAYTVFITCVAETVITKLDLFCNIIVGFTKNVKGKRSSTFVTVAKL